jgi:hypothetical protein
MGQFRETAVRGRQRLPAFQREREIEAVVDLVVVGDRDVDGSLLVASTGSAIPSGRHLVGSSS